MSSYYSRRITDADLAVTRSLPTSDGTVTTADIDLGSDHIPEGSEFVVEIPDLNSTHLPNADTLTITHQSGSSATPTTARASQVLTGAGGNGAGPSTLRFRAASDMGRYHNFKIVAAGLTGDMSAEDFTARIVT